MNKEVIEHYGWIVVVLVLGLSMILMATPLGNYIQTNMTSIIATDVIIKEEKQHENDIDVDVMKKKKINYVVNNGVWDGGYIDTYVVGKATSLPTNIKKQNYEFAGWYTSNSLTTMANISETTTGDITVYAKWLGKQYTISYNLNGGTFNDNDAVKFHYRFGNELSLPNHTMVTKDGYTFDGWYDETFSVRYETIYSSDNGNKTFYAKWIENK